MDAICKCGHPKNRHTTDERGYCAEMVPADDGTPRVMLCKCDGYTEQDWQSKYTALQQAARDYWSITVVPQIGVSNCLYCNKDLDVFPHADNCKYRITENKLCSLLLD